MKTSIFFESGSDDREVVPVLGRRRWLVGGDGVAARIASRVGRRKTNKNDEKGESKFYNFFNQLILDLIIKVRRKGIEIAYPF